MFGAVCSGSLRRAVPTAQLKRLIAQPRWPDPLSGEKELFVIWKHDVGTLKELRGGLLMVQRPICFPGPVPRPGPESEIAFGYGKTIAQNEPWKHPILEGQGEVQT